jgi:AcrR family transcriptional regulator
MEQTDPRIRRTQTALAKALLALTLEKGYEAVTIRDLAERAGIGYATFFRHYPHKAALLHDVLDVFVEELLAVLQDRAGQPGQSAFIFSYIQEHQALARVLLASQGPSALVERLQATSVAHVLAQSRPRAGSPVPPEIAAHHLVTASIALIQWWLDHDLPYPPEQMGAIYDALVVQPTQTLAFEAERQ